MSSAVSYERIWRLKSAPEPLSINGLSQDLKISPWIAQLLIQRGITDSDQARSFLECRLRDLADPFLLEGMDRAVARIFAAVKNSEKIMVHGDYDVDGITGTALLCGILSRMGVTALPYIPDRVSEGYGVSQEAIEKAAREGIRLLITVDCGSSAFEEIERAVTRGLDVIVVDHHELKERIPDCVAVIHPRRVLASGSISFQDLSGVGVAFKLAHALMKQGLKENLAWASCVDLKDFLDLVGIGTVADLVPLRGENKTLVKHGLLRLAKTKCLGLRALLDVIGISNRSITTTDIGYRIAPRMNAAGRVGTAYDAIRLLLTQDADEGQRLARGLDEDNRKRQAVEQATFEEAVAVLEKQSNGKEDLVLVLSENRWPLGVIGIVASRIVKLKHRPTLIISSDNGLGKGSARSIRGFHICEALKHCKDLLVGYGGHAYAAGVKINPEMVPAFRERINQYASEVLKADDLKPSFEVELEISMNDVCLELAQELEMLEPFGQENPQPLFMTRGLRLKRLPQIVGSDHLKFWVAKGTQESVEGIAFGMGNLAPEFQLNRPFDAIYELGINHYGGEKKLQLIFRDLRV